DGGDDRRSGHRAHRQQRRRIARQLAADQQIDARRDERNQRDEMERVVHQCFINVTSSMLAVRRVRKMPTTMARPTAASAPAVAMTRKAMAWPFMSCSARANASNVRLAALSMSSTLMSTISALRRQITPHRPIANRIAASSRKLETGIMTALWRP